MPVRVRLDEGGEDCVEEDAFRELVRSLRLGVLEPEPMELPRKFIVGRASLARNLVCS